ncbi:MAG TPA: hypothetical protein VLV78_07640 [Thermoanaerobaculia bacterium]|nr:hypothetical protein [Thermoanaerobaculia bacterium]
MKVLVRCAALMMVLAPLPALAQTPPPDPPPTHDITKVDPAPLGGAIAVPLPEDQLRQMRKYGLDELAGSRQAIGSQLIDGHLPRPLLDYYVHSGNIDQRLSIFERGLVVIRMTGAGGIIQKRVIIPDGAVRKYLESAAPEKIEQIRTTELRDPTQNRIAFLRVYRDGATFVERVFDPSLAPPKILHDAVLPIEDLLRAISEDREVTSTLAGYEPHVGDELVGDDRKTWRVERIISSSGIVELHCTSQPMVMYVAKKDLYNYFVGRPSQ